MQQKLLERDDDMRVHEQLVYWPKSMSHIAADMTFIEHNCQTFSIRSLRLSTVKCQIPSERGRKEGRERGISREITPFRGATSHVSRSESGGGRQDIILAFSTFPRAHRSEPQPA